MVLQTQVLLIVILLFCSAFFSSSETALFSLNRLRLKRKQEKNPFDSLFVARLLENPRRLLQVILFGNEIVNITTSVLVAAVFYEHFHDVMPALLVALLPIFISMPLIVIFGEIVPKAIAVKFPELISRFNAPLLNLFTLVVRPVQKIIDPFVSWFIRVVLRTSSEVRIDASTHLDEETFRSMLELGHSEGEIHAHEKDLIHRVLELDDQQVHQLMTPKGRVFALDIDTPLEKIIELIKQQRYSRIPVYQKSIERISGMLYTKDLLRLLRGEKKDLRGLMRPAYFVPRSRKVSEMLHDFQEHQIHIAVVVDEYGLFSGLISLQDILDRLFMDAYQEKGGAN
jgi:putative hemolysin